MKIRFFFSLFFLFLFSFANAQRTAPLPTFESPYNTVLVHLYYLQPDSYQPEIAAKALYGNPDNAQELAIQLKQILDGKGLFVKLENVPTDSSYQDSLTNKSIYVLFPKEMPEIYVQKFGNQWFFPPSAVQTIARLHKEVYPFGADLIVKFMPQFGQMDFLGVKLWQYIGTLFLVFFAFILYQIFNLIFRPIVKSLLKSRFQEVLPDSKLVWKTTRLLSLVVIVWFSLRIVPVLQYPARLTETFVLILKIIQIVFGIYFFLRLTDILIFYLSRWTARTKNTLDEQLMPIIKTSLYAIFSIGGIINVLSLLEINVTALIAGISIGGLAIALAAQDTVKNLIGSVMIFADRPFQIGDLISLDGVTGTVEEVGFRSTRLRTPQHSVTVIPNGVVANMTIENLGLRVYRRFNITIGITYDTPPERIESFVEGIRELLKYHPKVKQDNFQVQLNNMGEAALQIFFLAFLNVANFTQELKAKQELLLGIIRLAQVLQINFAFPPTSVYVEKTQSDLSTSTDEAILLKAMQALIENYRKQFEVSDRV